MIGTKQIRIFEYLSIIVQNYKYKSEFLRVNKIYIYKIYHFGT